MGSAASLFAVGFFSMLGQVVLLRELVVASFGVELIYVLGTGLWLAAGAAGAVAGRGRTGSSDASIGTAFLLMSLAFPLEIAFLRGARVLFGGVPGAYLPLGNQIATAGLGLVPAGAVLGWLFRRAAGGHIDAGGSLAAAYAWECAGGAAGSVAATLSVWAGIPNATAGLVLGLAGTAAAAASRRASRGPVLPFAAVLLALVAFSGAMDRRMTAWNHGGLVETADTPYGRITVTRAQEQLAVFENDALAYESEGTEAEEFVRLAALQAPARPRILVLGGGAAGIVAEARRLDPARVDCVELDRRMFRTLLPHLGAEARQALESPAVRVIFEDPRRFLSAAGTYDLILVAAPDPASGQSNRFYTREFFRMCAARLAPEGAVAFRLSSAENLWTAPLLRRNASVYAALRSAFRDVLVLPGGTDTFLASGSPLTRDPGVLAGRLAGRGGAGRLVTAEYVEYLLTNDRTERIGPLLEGTRAPENTDERPLCYQQTGLLWLGMFLPALERAEVSGRRLGAAFLALAAVLVAFARRRAGRRRAGIVFAAGFAGMAVEAVVLLRYQAEVGSLYQDIGVLLTSFMAGLAAGAFAFDRAVPKGRAAPRSAGAALLCALAVLSAALAVAAGTSGAFFRMGPAAATLALSGALVAGLFSYASRRGVEDPEGAVSPLYAADLLGGCVGSVAAGLLFIPLSGLGATAAGTAVAVAAALLLL